MFRGPLECRDWPRQNVLRKAANPARRIKEKAMLYAMLAYHVEAEVTSWTPEEDAAADDRTAGRA